VSPDDGLNLPPDTFRAWVVSPCIMQDKQAFLKRLNNLEFNVSLLKQD
jgi:hypothetical protein